MSEFNDQLNNNLKRDIEIFKAEDKYDSIRNLYKNNFDIILDKIKKYGVKQSIEDIADIDESLSKSVYSERQLLQQINIAINNGILLKNDIV